MEFLHVIEAFSLKWTVVTIRSFMQVSWHHKEEKQSRLDT